MICHFLIVDDSILVKPTDHKIITGVLQCIIFFKTAFGSNKELFTWEQKQDENCIECYKKSPVSRLFTIKYSNVNKCIAI